jgi:hypothetical protein
VVAWAATAGVNLAPLSLNFAGEPAMSGLLMGYAGIDDALMRPAFIQLHDIIAGDTRSCAPGLWET